MMMKERHSYIIRTALMAASGILLCGIAEAVRPEVDLSVDVPADKVVIADGILDQETQNDTDESFSRPSDEENGTPDSHGIPIFKWSGGRLRRICSVGNGV